MIEVGLCGFAKLKKEYYKRFKIVELQQTFYNLPKIETLKKYKEEAPVEFEFIIKANQLITHPPSSPTYRKLKMDIKNSQVYGNFKPTKEVLEIWDFHLQMAEILKTKIIIFQSPSSFNQSTENIKNIKEFFSRISKDNLIIGWEVRGKWKDSLLNEIFEEYKIIHTTDPFARLPLTKDIAYFRLHGSPPGDKIYNYKYKAQDFEKLIKISKNFKKVYCLFNNIYMWEDASEFLQRIKSPGTC